MDNLGKNWQEPLDNGGTNWQLINILICGYRYTIGEKCVPKLILVWGTGASASN
jgi:hypothetical protein